jgi:hypothetical protein
MDIKVTPDGTYGASIRTNTGPLHFMRSLSEVDFDVRR